MSNNGDLYALVGEPIAILRKRFLIICENNYCAAMLLDIFCAKAATAKEMRGCLDEGDDRENPVVYKSASTLQQNLMDLFSIQEVIDAIKYLLETRYVSGWINTEDVSGKETLKIVCNPV